VFQKHGILTVFGESRRTKDTLRRIRAPVVRTHAEAAAYRIQRVKRPGTVNGIPASALA